MTVRQAGDGDLESVEALFREYASSIQSDVCFQSLEREIAGLPGRYAPPDGRLLIALADGHPAGCVAMRRLEPEVCEMKRLYVRSAFRGAGLGRLLAETILSEARDAGYVFMRLDTLPRMERAIAMYRSLGFRNIPRYGDNPETALCFEITLLQARTGTGN